MDIGEDWPARLVGEADVTELDRRPVRGQSGTIGVPAHPRLSIDQGKNPVRGRGPGQNAGINAGKLPHRVGNRRQA